MITNMKESASGVLHMLHAAIQADTEFSNDKRTFLSLPYTTRFKLINDVIRTCELQAEWACKNNRMTDDEFDTFDMLCSKSIKQLRGIVTSPAFRTAMAQHSAAEAMTG